MAQCLNCRTPVPLTDVTCPNCGGDPSIISPAFSSEMPRPSAPVPPPPPVRPGLNQPNDPRSLSPVAMEEIKDRVRQRDEDRKVFRMLSIIGVLLVVVVVGWSATYAMRLRQVGKDNAEGWQQFQARERAAAEAREGTPVATPVTQRPTNNRPSNVRQHADTSQTTVEQASQKLKCGACGGTGKCFFCHGTGKGWQKNALGQYTDCDSCHGSGVCSACHGAGYVLRVTCSTCSGSGRVEPHQCYRCGGHGQTTRDEYAPSNPNGMETITCPECGGSGSSTMCIACHGSGVFDMPPDSSP